MCKRILREGNRLACTAAHNNNKLQSGHSEEVDKLSSKTIIETALCSQCL